MLIDRLDMLSDRQTIDGTVYSTFAKDLESDTDWGQGGAPRYVQVILHGAFDLGATLDVQLLGSTKPDFSDAFTILDSQPIKKEDLSASRSIAMLIPPIDKKYRYITLKYIVESGSESSADHQDEADLCPSTPDLNVGKDDANNTFTAFITNTITSKCRYPYVNQTMITA